MAGPVAAIADMRTTAANQSSWYVDLNRRINAPSRIGLAAFAAPGIGQAQLGADPNPNGPI